MHDCSDLGNCAIPMWMQYLILIVFFGLFLYDTWKRANRDPYDRW